MEEDTPESGEIVESVEIRSERDTRKYFPHLKDVELLDYFEGLAALIASRKIGIVAGVTPRDNPLDAQYRLSSYAAYQEILRRMKKE